MNKGKQTIIKSIVKDSDKLRKALINKWDKLGLSHQDVVKAAQKSGQNITGTAISRYLHNPYFKGALSEEKILWLAKFYDIDVKLIIKKL